MNLQFLTDPLTEEEIEFRIGNASPERGFSLLPYKTARTDRMRLDLACGCLGWSNRHYNDANGNICCEISIFDENRNHWVSKSDVGTEPFTEKEKGSYSDSFKRAGYRWGIGVELYDSPHIWVMWDKWIEKKSKKVPDVNISNWKIKINSPKVGISGDFQIIDQFGTLVWSTTGKIKNKERIFDEHGIYIGKYMKKELDGLSIHKIPIEYLVAMNNNIKKYDELSVNYISSEIVIRQEAGEL